MTDNDDMEEDVDPCIPERRRLVTVFGGTGFLGRRIVRHLLGRGFAVRAAVRHPERVGGGVSVG